MFRISSIKPTFAVTGIGIGLLIGMMLLFAACVPPQPAAPLASNAPTQPAAQATAAMTETMAMSGTMGLTLMVCDSPKFGKVLIDDKGMTLYVFDKDEKGKSNCSGDCAKNWPPLTVKEENEKVMNEGVTGALGTIKRDDGAYQVTLNGMPLYYYAKDTKMRDMNGQGVGDVWWVVAPDGTKVTKK